MPVPRTVKGKLQKPKINQQPPQRHLRKPQGDFNQDNQLCILGKAQIHKLDENYSCQI